MSDTNKDIRKQVNGQILVQLSKSNYVSGETISGNLCINLEQEYKGHILQVTLEGIEKTKYSYIMMVNDSKQYQSRRYVFGDGLNRFVDFSIPIYDFVQGSSSKFVLLPGQWQIQFKIGIADILPSSFSNFENEKNYCNLNYRVVATIIPTDDSVMPLQGFQDIRISKISDTLLEKGEGELEQSQEIQFGTCCSQGKFTMKSIIDKTSLFPGETAKVTVNCDLTNLEEEIDELDVELVGLLTLKSTNSERREKSLRIVQVGERRKANGKSINEEISLQAPMDANFTCIGNIIRLEYYVKISPVIYGVCCNDPSLIRCIKYPILMYPNPSTSILLESPPLAQGNLPHNWSPMQLQQMEFSPQQATQIQQEQAKFTAVNQIQLQGYGENTPIIQESNKQNQSISFNQESYYQ